MGLSVVRSGAYLHHLHLTSHDPERLARFYAHAMDMEASLLDPLTWVCRGPGRTLLISEGADKGLAFGAFACRDRDGLDDIKHQAREHGVAIEQSNSPLFGADSFSVRDPEDRRIVFGLAPLAANSRRGLRGPLQHLTLASPDVDSIEKFYAEKLGFAVSDRVVDGSGTLMTSFMRSNHEHHTLACFRTDRVGVDHHSYEAAEWDTIRDWCDRLAERGLQLMWGPGRHGPGNNLFVFLEDPDGNWIEISAELEVVHDRPVKEWPHEPRTLNLWGTAVMRA